MKLAHLILAIGLIGSCKSRTMNVSENKDIFGEGASNTRGVQASFPLDVRIKHQLRSNGVDDKTLLGDKNLMVSVDYFFPTNFPEFGDENISVEQVEEIVSKKLDLLQKKYQYIIFLLLLDQDNLQVDALANLKLNKAPALKNIANELSKTPLRQNKLKKINELIQKTAGKNSNFLISDLLGLSNDILIEKNTSLYRYIFASDKIHLTDQGQGLVLNKCVFPSLRLIPELMNQKLPDIENNLSFDKKWKAQVIKTVADDPANFKDLTAGSYWGRIVSMAKLQPANSKLELKNTEQDDALKKIQSKISFMALLSGPAEHFVSLRDGENSSKILNLDLSKSIFFTSIDLPSVGEKFEGWGYDYWSSVDKSPAVNYHFEVVRSKKDSQTIQVTWTIFPLVTVNGQPQTKRLVRESFLEPELIKELKRSENDISYLQYIYEMQLVKE